MEPQVQTAVGMPVMTPVGCVVATDTPVIATVALPAASDASVEDGARLEAVSPPMARPPSAGTLIATGTAVPAATVANGGRTPPAAATATSHDDRDASPPPV